MAKLKLALATTVLTLFITCVGVSIYIGSQIYSKYNGQEIQFTIKPGEGFSSVNYRLSKNKIITNPRVFHYYTKFKNKISSLKAGTYNIPTGTNMKDVLEILTEGTPILTRITIPEGKNMYQIARILEDEGLTTYEEFIKYCKDSSIIKIMGIDAPSIEGYLFPETYMFAPKTPAKEIVLTMLRQFQIQTKGLSLKTNTLSPHQVIILASIVEKETGAKWERPTIAGVYLNRLKKGMRLQADPTTIYGIWEKYNGNLQKKHLLEKTAYNTYKINGLPLGPIANPSLAAIKAVLNPKNHDYVYFVSKNDGTHIFTSTYKDHLKAVDYWQKNYRNRQGKSWRDLKQN